MQVSVSIILHMENHHTSKKLVTRERHTEKQINYIYSAAKRLNMA